MTKTSDSDDPPEMPDIEDTFAVPYIGNVKCTKVNGSQSVPPGDPPSWSVTVEGATVVLDGDISQGNEETTEYTTNGTITRDVAGNIVALLRSSSPQISKGFTIYNQSTARIATPGQLYQGMICTSESISAEDISVDGVKVAAFVRHEIQVEY
jgi:hypothetical protein